MRYEFEAEISGNTREEILKNAQEIWRAYIGSPDAALPWSAHISVSAAETSDFPKARDPKYTGTLRVDETSVDSRG